MLGIQHMALTQELLMVMLGMKLSTLTQKLLRILRDILMVMKDP